LRQDTIEDDEPVGSVVARCVEMGLETSGILSFCRLWEGSFLVLSLCLLLLALELDGGL
ncbi:hypothetical protein ACLOJK_001614, partial [Asimina triloba]